MLTSPTSNPLFSRRSCNLEASPGIPLPFNTLIEYLSRLIFAAEVAVGSGFSVVDLVGVAASVFFSSGLGLLERYIQTPKAARHINKTDKPIQTNFLFEGWSGGDGGSTPLTDTETGGGGGDDSVAFRISSLFISSGFTSTLTGVSFFSSVIVFTSSSTTSLLTGVSSCVCVCSGSKFCGGSTTFCLLVSIDFCCEAFFFLPVDFDTIDLFYANQ